MKYNLPFAHTIKKTIECTINARLKRFRSAIWTTLYDICDTGLAEKLCTRYALESSASGNFQTYRTVKLFQWEWTL